VKSINVSVFITCGYTICGVLGKETCMFSKGKLSITTQFKKNVQFFQHVSTTPSSPLFYSF